MRICVVRLSAMGDVAMAVPVLEAVSERYPDAEILLITRNLFAVFFEHIPNLSVLTPDLYGKHKGMGGLYRLFREIRASFEPDYFIDIHDVLRSKVLRNYFKSAGVRVAVIDKGRTEKKVLTQTKNKVLKPLKHTTERYADTFRKAGLDISLKYKAKKYSSPIELEGQMYNFGFAPFAAHQGKAFPPELVEILLTEFAKNGNIRIFIFGGGESEKQQAQALEAKFDNTVSIIGKYKIKEELGLMSRMDVMLVPDSGNMHLAALTGTPVVSVWGATHPHAGFTPFVTKERLRVVQNESLSCRPCSVFGNKPCYKENYECLTTISADQIITETDRFTKKKLPVR